MFIFFELFIYFVLLKNFEFFKFRDKVKYLFLLLLWKILELSLLYELFLFIGLIDPPIFKEFIFCFELLLLENNVLLEKELELELNKFEKSLFLFRKK